MPKELILETPEEIIKRQDINAVDGGVLAPDQMDVRDFDAEEMMGSNLDIVVDWDKGFNALTDVWSDMPNQDQKQQYSCVARAWAHYKQRLQVADTGEKTILSAKSIYNPIATPGVGSYVRDGGMRTVKYGVNKESSVPSDGTEAEITAPFDFNPFEVEAGFYKNLTIASVSTQNFDTLAKMIILNHGFVSGWKAHCQYFKAFGKLQGRRFLKTHGSYASDSDDYYFEGTADKLFSIWTGIDVDNIENQPTPLPPPDALLEDVRYGDTGQKFDKLKNALQKIGWMATPSLYTSYDNRVAQIVLNFTKSNYSPHNSWRYFWDVIWATGKYHQGRLVSSELRQVINNLIK